MGRLFILFLGIGIYLFGLLTVLDGEAFLRMIGGIFSRGLVYALRAGKLVLGLLLPGLSVVIWIVLRFIDGSHRAV